MKFRTLTVDEDSEALAALHGACFSNGWDAVDFDGYLRSETEDVIGGFIRGALSGLAVARTVIDQSDILTIGIEPAHRGKGHAASLLAAAERVIKARGSTIVFLDVAEDNVPAIALYRRAGYVQHGRRSGYYRRPESRMAALLFQKRL